LFAVELFPAERANKLSDFNKFFIDEINSVVVRQSVLLVDLDVSENRSTNSANQQQKIVVKSGVSQQKSFSFEPFFTDQASNSSHIDSKRNEILKILELSKLKHVLNSLFACLIFEELINELTIVNLLI
jgi:hypothetical protein